MPVGRIKLPAFKANILVDDVIISINGIEIVSQSDFLRKLPQFANTMCEVVILREGKQIKVSVMSNPDPQAGITPINPQPVISSNSTSTK